MKATIEEQKQEAVERMQIIGIYPETIKQFKNGGKVSESAPPLAACYWLNSEQKKRVKEFEQESGALVYHVIHGNYLLGGTDVFEMESYLFVEPDKDAWPLDREDLENPEGMSAYVYVYNVDAPELSELGSIGIKVGPAGGLVRTY